MVKVQLACDLRRRIIFYSGLHAGAESDQTIGKDTIHSCGRKSWEWWLGVFRPVPVQEWAHIHMNRAIAGDGIYFAVDRLLVGAPVPPPRPAPWGHASYPAPRR